MPFWFVPARIAAGALIGGLFVYLFDRPSDGRHPVVGLTQFLRFRELQAVARSARQSNVGVTTTCTVSILTSASLV